MLIIGISGGTGSGKTTIVNHILSQLPPNEVVIISQDNYYHDSSHLPLEERFKINFDHPDSIDFKLLTKHINALKKGKSIEQPSYSFISHSRTGEVTITNPKKIIIVEGILVLTNPELRNLFDIKLFVHADADERLIRRIRRDIRERGRDLDEVLNRYQSTLKPMHEKFIEPCKNFADLIIPNDKKVNEIATEIIKSFIINKLK